jgi:large subunit ribosomal protein L29
LRELEKSIARDAFKARFKNFTNRLDDTSSIAKARKDLARVKTILAQRDREAAAAKQTEAKAVAS